MGVRITNNNQGGSIRVLRTTPNAKGAVWLGFYLLDRYPGAVAAYSLRKLRIQYTGPVVRVRRSSDNAEMDIGFDFSRDGSVLDENALLSFVGGGDGFVTRWYDQSGNGVDQARTIANQQPQIVTNGTIYRDNGKPALWFNGSMSMRSIINVSLTSVAGEWSSFGVVRVLDISINRQILSYFAVDFFGDLPIPAIGQFLRTGALTNPPSFQTIAFNTLGNNFTDAGLAYNANQNIINSIRTTTSVEMFVIGVGNGPTITTGTPTTGVNPLDIGSRNGINFTMVQPFGYIQELIHYPANTTSTYLNIIREVNSYYKVF
jgi:hypothetical protein